MCEHCQSTCFPSSTSAALSDVTEDAGNELVEAPSAIVKPEDE